MKGAIKDEKRYFKLTGLNLGLCLKAVLIITTLTASSMISLLAFTLFCVTQQSNRQNFIFGQQKACFTDTQICKYVLKSDDKKNSSTQRIRQYIASIYEYGETIENNQLEHLNSSNKMNTSLLFAQASKWIGRALRWKVQLPDFSSIDIDGLLDEAIEGAYVYEVPEKYGNVALLLFGLYPEQFDAIEQALIQKLDETQTPNNLNKHNTLNYISQQIYELSNSGSSRLSKSMNSISKGRFGYPYRFLVEYSSNNILIQLGSQYAFSIGIKNVIRPMIFLQLILLPAFFFIIPQLSTLLLAELASFITLSAFTQPNELRASFGYDPYTVKSELFLRNADFGVTYNLGNIALNTLMNILAVSSIGFLFSANILIQMFQMRTYLMLFGCALISEFLTLLQIKVGTPPPYKLLNNNKNTKYSMPLTASCIEISSPIINKCHAILNQVLSMGQSEKATP
ncbi:hypothetical protein OAT84_03510 [Gammaproteobacteria bacterium]|nr:hypothetical protein [Gammaproteobacteria bacterium]